MKGLIETVFWTGMVAFLFVSQVTQAMELSLQSAQEVAVQENQMLQAAREGVKRAEAVKLQTWGGHLPTIRLSEGAMRSNDAVNAFGFRLKQERFTQNDFVLDALNHPDAITNFQTKLEVLQPIINGGRSIYGRRQASEGVLAAKADLMGGEDEVRFRTAEAYWGLLLAQEALKAVQQGLETARAHESIAEARYREEAAPLSDLLAARVRVAELREEEIETTNRVFDAADGLSLVMGIEIGSEIMPSDVLGRRRVSTELNAVIVQAGVSRPDLLAVRHRAMAAKHGVGAARASYLPHLNAFLEVNLDSDEILRREGESWTAGAKLTWDLFSGGRSIGAHRAAKAQAAAAEAQADFKKSDVIREVRKAYRDVMAADTKVDVAEEGIRQAEERLRIMQLQYQEGLATATDLLAAEAELTRARVRRLQALYALNLGIAQLEFSVGSPVE